MLLSSFAFLSALYKCVHEVFLSQLNTDFILTHIEHLFNPGKA